VFLIICGIQFSQDLSADIHKQGNIIMVDVVAPLINQLPEPVKLFIAATVFLVIVAPQLSGLYRSIVDFRLGAQRLEMKRAQLEIIKLRYEVEQLRKANSVAQLDQELELLFPPVMTRPVVKRPELVQPPNWLASHPRLGSVMLEIIQLILAIPLVFCVFFALIFLIPTKEFPFSGLTVVEVFIFGSLAWLFYRGVRWARKLHRRLKLSRRGEVQSQPALS
jgi:hypothetical protein